MLYECKLLNGLFPDVHQNNFKMIALQKFETTNVICFNKPAEIISHEIKENAVEISGVLIHCLAFFSCRLTKLHEPAITMTNMNFFV